LQQFLNTRIAVMLDRKNCRCSWYTSIFLPSIYFLLCDGKAPSNEIMK